MAHGTTEFGMYTAVCMVQQTAQHLLRCGTVNLGPPYTWEQALEEGSYDVTVKVCNATNR